MSDFEEIRDILEVVAKSHARSMDVTTSKQIGVEAKKHPEVKRFLKERFVLVVMPQQVRSESLGQGGLQYKLTQRYAVTYNSPSLINRIKFFIFDLSTWLKEKTRNV